jgi:hypothetical protein
MKNIDKLKQMTARQITDIICIDEEGQISSNCNICYSSGACNGDCYGGVLKWLETEATDG